MSSVTINSFKEDLDKIMYATQAREIYLEHICSDGEFLPELVIVFDDQNFCSIPVISSIFNRNYISNILNFVKFNFNSEIQ